VREREREREREVARGSDYTARCLRGGSARLLLQNVFLLFIYIRVFCVFLLLLPIKTICHVCFTHGNFEVKTPAF